MKKLNRSDLSYTFDCYGYMIRYKGKPIGGAGSDPTVKQHWQHRKKNLKDNEHYAEITIRDIMNGRIRPDMQTAIEKIIWYEMKKEEKQEYNQDFMSKVCAPFTPAEVCEAVSDADEEEIRREKYWGLW